MAACCLFSTMVFVSCARADAAISPHLLSSRRLNGMVTTDGRMGEMQWWANFTSSITRPDEGEDSHWPELQLNPRSVAAIILGGIGASLCTAAGLGGGGLFVPLFNLLLQFDSKTSAALSNFMIVGGQSITLLMNLARTHPDHPGKPLIDFDAALLLQPNLLLGISVGVILNFMFPNWIITLLLILMLTYLTVNSYRSGVKRWNKESEQLALSSRTAGTKTVAQSPNTSGGPSGSLREPLLDRHSTSRFPTKKILALALVWLAFGAVQVLREGRGGQSKCGFGYWLLTATQVPLALIVTYFVLKNQHSADTSKNALQSADDGFVLTPEASSSFTKMSLLTGILGGMLGIGGAMIINPMLMSAGMHPQVTAATSGFIVVFSASMSVVQYWIMGRVPVNWALTAAALSALFSAVGILVVQRILNKYGRASLIVFVVAFVIGISAILMGSLGGLHVWQQFQSGAYMGFHSPC